MLVEFKRMKIVPLEDNLCLLYDTCNSYEYLYAIAHTNTHLWMQLDHNAGVSITTLSAEAVIGEHGGKLSSFTLLKLSIN